jgi:hypothetical protein
MVFPQNSQFKTQNLLGMVACIWNPSYSGGRGRRITKASLGKILSKKLKVKGTGSWFKWWNACLASVRLSSILGPEGG